jgi:hypothetical protein
MCLVLPVAYPSHPLTPWYGLATRRGVLTYSVDRNKRTTTAATTAAQPSAEMVQCTGVCAVQPRRGGAITRLTPSSADT